MAKKILITGASGYLGSVLGSYLSDKGHECIGVDVGFFKDALFGSPPNFPVSNIDARDISEDLIKGFDVVVNLAGISNDPVGNLKPENVYDPTRHYSFKIAKICKQLGIKFIFASSCSVYGVGNSELMNEGSLTTPQTYYSLNKLQIENDLASIGDEKFSPIALRFATIYGPSPRIRFDLVINMFVGMALTQKEIILNSDGQAWRPNLYINDACEAIYLAIEHQVNHSGLLTLNVGHESSNMNILEIANIVASKVNGCRIKFLSQDSSCDKEGLIKDRKIVNGKDSRTYKVSFERIRNYFPQFICKTSVNNGVTELINFLNEGKLTSEIFKSPGFYRLQQLEMLHKSKLISDDLRWVS